MDNINPISFFPSQKGILEIMQGRALFSQKLWNESTDVKKIHKFFPNLFIITSYSNFKQKFTWNSPYCCHMPI
jgi:hypothetical protein